MYYAHIGVITCFFTIGSSISCMEMSLKRSAGLAMVSCDEGLELLDQEKLGLIDVKPLLDELFCKENLPESYHSSVQTYILAKRHAAERQDEELGYLDDQVVNSLGQVSGITFVGTTAVAFGESGAMQWWDTVSGTLLREQKYDQVYRGIVSSKNGSLVAALSGSNCVLWSAVTYEEVDSFAHEEELPCAGFSPDGNYIAVASRTGKVVIWNLLTQKMVVEFSGNVHSRINAIEMAQDRVHLLSKNVVTVWDYNANTFITSVIRIGNTRCTYSRLLSDKVILCLSDSSIKLFNLKDGSEKVITFDTNIMHEGQPHETVVRPITCCQFSSNESLLILGETERTSLWCRKKSDPLKYQFFGAFPAATDIAYLAIRNNDLAFLVAEKKAGLQLFTLPRSLENVPFTVAKEALTKRQKTAKGLQVGLPVNWYLKL